MIKTVKKNLKILLYQLQLKAQIWFLISGLQVHTV